MNTWSQNVDILVKNIKEYVTKAKRQGTVGMSVRNLKQVVSTRGVDFPNTNAFERGFEQAVELVRKDVRGFDIYESAMNTKRLIESIRRKDWHKANFIFGKVMEQKLTTAVEKEKQALVKEDSDIQERPCPECGGAGDVKGKECQHCDGQGVVRESVEEFAGTDYKAKDGKTYTGKLAQQKKAEDEKSEKPEVKEEKEVKRCELCGSTKDLHKVGDDYVCAECDVED